jgi:hypothetical protein
MLLVLIAPAPAQEARPGIGVDARGGQVIDPTKNVLDLVQALKEMLAELRVADNKRQDELRAAEAKIQNYAREAETRRIDQLAAQKQLFDLELARVLKANVDTSALLLSTQLKEVKTDLQVELRSLNQFRWESAGKGAGLGDAFGYAVGVIGLLVAAGALFFNARRGTAK